MNAYSTAPSSVSSETDSAIGQDFGEDEGCDRCQLIRRSHRERSSLVDSKDIDIIRKQSRRLTEWDIHNISNRFNTEWKPLARELEFSEEKIASFQEKENQTERVSAMLNAFIRHKGKEATIGRLVKALRDEKVARTDIAEVLQGNYDLDFDGMKPLETMYKRASFVDNRVEHTLCQTKDGRFFELRQVDNLEVLKFKKACQKLSASKNDPINPTDPENSTVAAAQFPKQEENIDYDSEDILGKELIESLKQYQDDFKLHTQDLCRCLRDASTAEKVKKCEILVGKLRDCFNELQNKSKEVFGLSGETFGVKTQTYDKHIMLANSQRELQEIVKMLKKNAEEKIKELPKEVEKLGLISNSCESLGKEVQMCEELYRLLLPQEYTKPERTRSEPIKTRSHVPGTWRPNSAIEPDTLASGPPPPKNKPEENKEVDTPLP